MRKQIILVSLLIVLAFLYRVVPHLHAVFTPYGVNWMCVDPSYQMRLVDNMLANYPHALWNDPYALFPDGAAVGYRPVLPFIISSVTLLISGGHPWVGLADTVGAFVPPVLGALTVGVVYVTGTVMFRRKSVGAIAAVLVAFLPTEFLHRSLLGFTDHHIVEIFLCSLTVMFLALAWKQGKVRWGFAAGVSLGLYLWNWHGALFFAGVFLVAFCVAFLVAYVREPWHDWLRDKKWLSGLVCFGTAALVFAPLLPRTLSPREFSAATVALLAVLPVLLALARIRKKWVFFLALATASGAAAFAIQLVAPWVPGFAAHQVKSVFWGWGSVISEALPSLPSELLVSYGFVIVLALAGVVVGIKYRVDLPFVLWSVVIMLAEIGQRRWGYYAAINLCLLAAFALVFVAKYIVADWRTWLLALTTFALVLCTLPGITAFLHSPAIKTPEWAEAMVWLRDHTPAPFGDEAAYTQLRPGTKPSYGVLSWWDYGHWVIRDAHRVPVSSPTYQETQMSWAFFIAQSPEEAEKAIAGFNIKYVLIDRDMVGGKFPAIVIKSGASSLTRAFWQNSMAYRLFNEPVVGNYRIVFWTPNVRIFERFPEGEVTSAAP